MIRPAGVVAIANTSVPSERDRRADQHAALRPVAVERDAERNLRGREGEEERARQQPDLGGRKADLAREIRRDDADRIAQELADQIDRRERADEQRRRRAACARLGSASMDSGSSPPLTGRRRLVTYRVHAARRATLVARKAASPIGRCRFTGNTAIHDGHRFRGLRRRARDRLGRRDPAVLPHLARRRGQGLGGRASIR